MNIKFTFHIKYNQNMYCILFTKQQYHKLKKNLNNIKTLILDFKGLEYISSAGLRVLLSAQKKMQKIGEMKVMNVCEEVMEVFEMTGFADVLVIE